MKSVLPVVDFMIVGAMKCGTSSLAFKLAEHPDICFSKQKEPHFFSKTYSVGALKKYHELFSHPKKLCGEASTTYSCYPEFNKDTATLIYNYNPKMKLIYVMRDPVRRAVSNYMHLYTRGYTRKGIDQILDLELGLINRGKYFTQIKRYIDLFGRSQVMLVSFEQLVNNPSGVLVDVLLFLGVSDKKLDLSKLDQNNKTEGIGKLDYRIEWINRRVISVLPAFVRPKVRTWVTGGAYTKIDKAPQLDELALSELRKIYAEEVFQIERLIGRKLTEWKTFYGDVVV